MSSKKKRNKKIKPPEKKQACLRLPVRCLTASVLAQAGTQTGADTHRQGTDSRVIRRFILHYFILMAVFVFLKDSEFIQNIIDINGLYSESITLFTSKILGMMGIVSTYYGSIIQLPSISFDIKFGCNGLEAVMIYAIGVAAFPGNWKRKLIGIAVGLIILQIINLVRIVFLAWSGVYYKAIFETIHIYVAPGIMIAVALFLFLVYLNILVIGQSSFGGKNRKKQYEITMARDQ